MKRFIISALVLALSLVSFAAWGAGHSAPASRGVTNGMAAAEIPIPVSVFNIPLTPQQGRNPFFPTSQTVVPVVPTNSAPVPDTLLVLNGITSPPKRMAMINGRSFEKGEAADVKLANGVRIPVECLEIHDDRVTVKVNGTRRELQLRNRL